MSVFVPLDEVIDIALLGNDDIQKRAKGRYRKWAKYVFQDLNMGAVKVAKRQLFTINKRTNTINLPHTSVFVCSVSVIDKNGTIHPLWMNDKLHDDIVDVAASRDCSCDKNCRGILCNTVKGYEAIVSTKSDYMPDGTPVSFECVDKKCIDDSGWFYEELQYPQRVYASGVWVDTIKYTERKKICRVQLDANGCICDTNENAELLCSACGVSSSIPVGGTASIPPKQGIDQWIYYCSSRMDVFTTQSCGVVTDKMNMIYNITEQGDRLIFPNNFSFDKVLVRFYEDISINKMQIPLICVGAFVLGLKWWDARFNDKKQNLAVKYGNDYAMAKGGLLMELEKRTLAEWRMILTPPVKMP